MANTFDMKCLMQSDLYKKLVLGYTDAMLYGRSNPEFSKPPYLLPETAALDELLKPGPLTWAHGQEYKPVLRGNRVDYMIIDDPINQEKPMTTKPEKAVKKDYNTIGVRFIYGRNADKVYTYKLAKGQKVLLGQEVVVPSNPERTLFSAGKTIKSVAAVVEIHKAPQDTGPYTYLFVDGVVKSL